MLPTTLRDGAYVPKRVKEEIDFDGPIERGAKKMRAQRVQEFLTLNGFAVSIDGDFGPATEKRVRDFQTARGLPATRATRSRYCSMQEPTPTQRHPTVRRSCIRLWRLAEPT